MALEMMFFWISFDPPKIDSLRLLKYCTAALAASAGPTGVPSKPSSSASATKGCAYGPIARRSSEEICCRISVPRIFSMELSAPGTPPPATAAMTRRLVVFMFSRSISTHASRAAKYGSSDSGRPFFFTFAAAFLSRSSAATEKPIFAHVNWFQRSPEDKHFLWPGYRDNLRPLLWLCALKDGEVTGRQTAVGIIPTEEELQLDGVEITPEDLATILTIDVERWRQEMGFREEHLRQFDNLPEEIWEAHRRVSKALDDAQ